MKKIVLVMALVMAGMVCMANEGAVGDAKKVSKSPAQRGEMWRKNADKMEARAKEFDAQGQADKASKLRDCAAKARKVAEYITAGNEKDAEELRKEVNAAMDAMKPFTDTSKKKQ